MARCNGIIVEAYRGEHVDSMLKRFKRKLKRERLMLDLREREFFTSKSEENRKKRRLRKKRMQNLMLEIKAEEKNNTFSVS